MARKPKPVPKPDSSFGATDQQGAAVQGQCRKGGRCWGPFKKISGEFPMKQCQVCRKKS